MFYVNSGQLKILMPICYSLPAVNSTPSSWSLDSGKEARNVSECGKLMSPPVPPRPMQTGMCVHLSLCILVTMVTYWEHTAAG